MGELFSEVQLKLLERIGKELDSMEEMEIGSNKRITAASVVSILAETLLGIREPEYRSGDKEEKVKK